MRLPLLALLLWAAPAWAAEPAIDAPEKVKPHALARLRVTDLCERAAVVWDIYPEGKADVEQVAPGRLVLTGPPGEYTVKVLVIEITPDGSPKVTTLRHKLTIGDPEPVPPPVPPVPPTPPSALRAKLQAAFAADTTPPTAAERDAARKDLAALWRKGLAVVNDPAVTTTGQLLDRMRQASAFLVGPTALPNVRKGVGEHLASALSADQPLTPELRARAAVLFGEVADALSW